MVTRYDPRRTWGILLVAAGAMFLLQNLGVFALGRDLQAILLAAAGLVLVHPSGAGSRWWALVVGISLMAMAALLSLAAVYPATAEAWGGTLVLGAIGASFWALVILRRERWWAVIPGGLLLTLAAVARPPSAARGALRLDPQAVFFLGLGLTFALAGLLPRRQGPMRWALIPGAAMVGLSLSTLAGAAWLSSLLWPAALVLGGSLSSGADPPAPGARGSARPGPRRRSRSSAPGPARA